MGSLSHEVSKVQVEAISPDQTVSCRLNSEAELRIGFLKDSYRRHDSASLESQLSFAMSDLWNSFKEKRALAVRRALNLADDFSMELPEVAVLLRQERSEIVARGVSIEASIGLASLGMMSWEVDIEDGVTQEITAKEFAEEFISAYTEVMRDYKSQVSLLYQRLYGEPHA